MNGVAVETESAAIVERRSAVDVANGARWTGDTDRRSAVDVANGARWTGDTDRLTTCDRSSLVRAHAAKSVDVAPASPRVRRALRESRRVSLAQASGYVQLNQYRLLEPIGQGSYGIVKLAYNEEDDTHYAMKILSKRKLMRRTGLFGRAPPRKQGPGPPPDPLQRVYREIAVLKKLDHPNVVKLVEVLDDPAEDQLYLVFQLLEGGPVIEIPSENPLSEAVARRYFRDVLLGVEYLHYQGIAHRDIKPANLLLGEGRVQVADLGASGELAGRLSGAVGTPAFRAPEATASDNYGGEAADIWSLGVTLFAMVTGRVPWGGSSSLELQKRVLADPLAYPNYQPSQQLRDLLGRMLDKNPLKRITLQETKEHEWVTAGGSEPLPSEQDNCRLVEVTEEDMARVVTSIPNLSTLILIKTMLKKHSFQNPFLRSREGSTARRESVSARDIPLNGRGGGGAAGEGARRGGLLARAGRSLSAPGNYMTERQTSFDVGLESVQEGRDQSQDIPTTTTDRTITDCHSVSTSQSVNTSQSVSTSQSVNTTQSDTSSQSIEIKSANSSKCVSRSQSVSDNTSSPTSSDVQSLNSSQTSVTQKSDSPSDNAKKTVNNSHSFRINEKETNSVSVNKSASTSQIVCSKNISTPKSINIKQNSGNHSVSSQISSKQRVSSQGINNQTVSCQNISNQGTSNQTVSCQNVSNQIVSYTSSKSVSSQSVSSHSVSSQNVSKNSQRKSSQETRER